MIQCFPNFNLWNRACRQADPKNKQSYFKQSSFAARSDIQNMVLVSHYSILGFVYTVLWEWCIIVFAD